MTEKAPTEGVQLLKDWLKKHGISQRAFAARVHASQATISNILKGGTRPGLALAQIIEQGTQFANPGDLDLVDPVPAKSWFTSQELQQIDELRQVSEAIKGRRRAYAESVLSQDVVFQVAQLLAQQERERMEATIKQSQRWALDAVAQVMRQAEVLRKAPKQNK